MFNKMRPALVAMICLSTGSGLAAETNESVKRLTRSVNSDDEGKLRADAKIGQIIVDQYGRVFNKFIFGKPPGTAKFAVETILCSQGIGDISRYQVRKLISAMSSEELTKLKSAYPSTLRQLSIGTIAALDGVEADAIVRDENLGPGIYHDSIQAMMVAIPQCRFGGKYVPSGDR